MLRPRVSPPAQGVFPAKKSEAPRRRLPPESLCSPQNVFSPFELCGDLNTSQPHGNRNLHLFCRKLLLSVRSLHTIVTFLPKRCQNCQVPAGSFLKIPAI